MTADPLTRRALAEIEQKRKARAQAEAEERRLAERLAALTPEERAELAARRNDKLFDERVFGWGGIAFIASGLWFIVELVIAWNSHVSPPDIPELPLWACLAAVVFAYFGGPFLRSLRR